jgi:hypothetical protein
MVWLSVLIFDEEHYLRYVIDERDAATGQRSTAAPRGVSGSLPTRSGR